MRVVFVGGHGLRPRSDFTEESAGVGGPGGSGAVMRFTCLGSEAILGRMDLSVIFLFKSAGFLLCSDTVLYFSEIWILQEIQIFHALTIHLGFQFLP